MPLKSVSVALPLEDSVLNLESASPPLPPESVYMLKKCVAHPLVIRRPELQSAGKACY